MHQYHLTLLSICEVRWNSFGKVKLVTGEILLYSGKDNEEDHHEAGVALLLPKEAARSLMEWEPVSDRIIMARFKSRFQQVSIIMCYAPTNNAEEDTKDVFYSQLQTVVDRIPRRDMLILMGDMNAKVGSDNSGRERVMGRNGLGVMNENGELLDDFCAVNELAIGGTLFPHRRCHKATWVSPDLQCLFQSLDCGHAGAQL
uniref:Endonuclease/exonuclease/phosphatase domain-containing protein n=1 Tax=Octopus bimaculoides TaxID=37653 RepID=A0A0L8GNS1_OCTBM